LWHQIGGEGTRIVRGGGGDRVDCGPGTGFVGKKKSVGRAIGEHGSQLERMSVEGEMRKG